MPRNFLHLLYREKIHGNERGRFSVVHSARVEFSSGLSVLHVTPADCVLLLSYNTALFDKSHASVERLLQRMPISKLWSYVNYLLVAERMPEKTKYS